MKKNKHCEKCSYQSEEGLVVSGCAYCGCHQSPVLGLPPEKLANIQNPSCIVSDETDWEIEFDKLAYPTVRSELMGDEEALKRIKSFIRHLLFERDNYWLTEMNLAIGKDLEEQKSEILKELDERIVELLKEFANTPLDKRGTGWDWLLKVKSIIEESKCKP